MELQHTHLRANIKREIMKIYKQRSGKGPDNVEISIFGELICIKIAGAFSKIEKSLMNTDTGKVIVASIRKELAHSHSTTYFPVIEELVRTRILKSTMMMDEDNDTVYLFLLLEGTIPVD